MVIIVIVVYVFIILIDQVSLFKEGIKKDFYVSSIMCLISFTIAILLALKVPIYSPSKPIENLVKFILEKL